MKALDILQRFSDRCESALGVNGEYVATLGEINEAIVELKAKLSNTEQLTCEWIKDAIGEEYDLFPVFYTKCGGSFVFSECGIKENNFIFCPYCGGEITSKDTK